MKFRKKIILALLTFITVLIPISENCYGAEEKRIVYLTFDDGPSPNNTENILKVLNENNVKATFFVVGTNVKTYPNVIQDLDENNMAVYPHCNNHEYGELYKSSEYYLNDLNQCETEIRKALGYDKKFSYVRIPGGADNLVASSEVLKSIKNNLKNSGINYIDWNVDSGDALAVKVSREKIKANIQKNAGSYKVDVLLMHDLENKLTTTQVLNEVINEYKMMGYEFKTLDNMESWEKEYLIKTNVINKK